MAYSNSTHTNEFETAENGDYSGTIYTSDESAQKYFDIAKDRNSMIYKDAHPQETVSQIKRILDSIGVKVRETFFDINGDFFSCRISIDNCGLESLDIGTNGKGITYDYSLASGYAELMERLQNKFLVNEAMRHSAKMDNSLKLKFRFFPDEELQENKLEDFFTHIRFLFPNYNLSIVDESFKTAITSSVVGDNPVAELEKTKNIKWLGAPFAHFSKGTKSIEYVPIILARANSSTGLCAGNTPHEAIIQGINEIFERYVLQRIYLDNITPPSFQSDFFKGTGIGKRLERLKKYGYVYDVKDMSLGKGFPVVGLVLTNVMNGTTMFRLGADLSPEIALERCLTEIYQGRTNEDLRFVEYPIDKTLDMEDNIYLRNMEYQKSLKDGTGYYPKSIFMRTPSYDFTVPVWRRCGSSSGDLNKILNYLYEGGYDVLIRDNSFLGFCAYQIIIPGLSDQDYRLRDIFSEYYAPFDLDIDNSKGYFSEHDVGQWPLYNLKSIKDARDFIRTHYPNDETIRLAPYCIAPQNLVNRSLLLFLYAIKNKDYKDANEHFSKMMQQRKKKGYPYNEYLACVGNYVFHKSQGVNEDEMIAWLSHFYSQVTIGDVLSDFEDPESVMRNYPFPTCFNCNSCPLLDNCHYRDAVLFEQMIQTVQELNPIDQKKLFDTIA